MCRYSWLAVGLWGAGVSLCQTTLLPNPQSPPQDRTTAKSGAVLRTTTRLVQINVIVEDKKGNPVENLTKDDFTLFVNGKPQAISLFSTEGGGAEEHVTAAGTAKSAASPHVFGNRMPHANERPGSVTVILFDALNTSLQDQAYARAQILAFLQEVQPQDHVAIYLLARRLRVISEFTQDAKSLAEAIERFRAAGSLILADTNQPYLTAAETGVIDPKAAQYMAALMNDMNSKARDQANFNRMQITAQAMEAIANRVAGIPGRKNLVWVSGSFPVSIALESNDNSPVDTESQNFEPELERVARALNQSNLAVYPVDPRGLLIRSEFDGSSAASFLNLTPDSTVGEEEQGTMNLIAERTGGRAFYNTNDIKGAIRRTLSESHFSYLIGFYSNDTKWDGQFHELKLHLKESGLVLRYRKGYYALPDPPNTVSEARDALQAAFWSPVDATSLGIQVRVHALEPSTRKLNLRVNVDANQLRFNKVDGKYKGNIDAVYLQLGPAETVVAADPLTYKLDLAEKDYQTIMEHGYELKAPISIRPTTKTLRVFVRDGASGTMGSVTIPVAKFLLPQPLASQTSDAH